MKALKRTRAVLLAAALLCPLLGGCGKTENSSSSGSSTESPAPSSYEYVFRETGTQKFIEPAAAFAGGTGTEADPYQISSAAELALLSQV